MHGDRINPRVDVAFKKIFGTEENKDLLISLVNSVVGAQDQVVDIKLLNPYNHKNFKNDKLSILDIKAEGHHGRKFNIEIQITDEGDYDKRALYGWAKLYKEYSSLEKVICIHILNFTSISQSKKYHNTFHVTEKESGISYFGDLELHTVELTKFTDTVQGDVGEIGAKIKTALDMWSAFLTRHDLLTEVSELPESLNSAELKKAIQVLRVMNYTDEEKEAYDDHLKWLRIESNTLKKAEEKGRLEGHKEGRQEGRLEGHKEGRLEEKRAIALALLKQNVPSETVAKVTSLSIDEIDSLQSYC